MSFELRPYQQQAIDNLRDGIRQGHRCQLLALATGAGKTVVAAAIVASARERGKKCVFIVHTKELVRQAIAHLAEVGLQVGVIQGDNTDFSSTDDVIVATVQSLRNRKPFHWVGLVIIDEAHILYQYHVRLMEHWDAVPFIGLSATPLTRGLGKYFSRLVRGPSVRDLTEAGALVPLRGFAPSERVLEAVLQNVAVGNTTAGRDYIAADLARAVNTKELIGDIVKTYQAKGEGRQALCFAVDVAHSKALAADFEAHGIASAHVDGYMADDDAKAVMDQFKAGQVQVLCSVAKLGVGFDHKPVSCAILARPTLSEMLHMQQLGRVLRPADGKVDALVLDHAGNCTRFGLPVDFEVPELDDGDKPSRDKRTRDPKAVACTSCGCLLEASQMTCPACGIDRPTKSSDVTYRDADLVEIGSTDTGERGYGPADYKRWYLGARRYFEERGKGHSAACKAAFGVVINKFKQRAPWSWNDLPTIEPDRDLLNYLKHQRIRYAKSRKPTPTACSACGSHDLVHTAGSGPHAAALRCGACGHFIRWLPKSHTDQPPGART